MTGRPPHTHTCVLHVQKIEIVYMWIIAPRHNGLITYAPTIPKHLRSEMCNNTPLYASSSQYLLAGGM